MGIKLGKRKAKLIVLFMFLLLPLFYLVWGVDYVFLPYDDAFYLNEQLAPRDVEYSCYERNGRARFFFFLKSKSRYVYFGDRSCAAYEFTSNMGAGKVVNLRSYKTNLIGMSVDGVTYIDSYQTISELHSTGWVFIVSSVLVIIVLLGIIFVACRRVHALAKAESDESDGVRS